MDVRQRGLLQRKVLERLRRVTAAEHFTDGFAVRGQCDVCVYRNGLAEVRVCKSVLEVQQSPAVQLFNLNHFCYLVDGRTFHALLA